MERAKKLLRAQPSYEPVDDEQSEHDDSEPVDRKSTHLDWTKYAIFVLLGVEMLWAW